MREPKVSACRVCGAAIIWARTVGGARQAVDAEPIAGGHLELRRGPDGVLVARRASLETATGYAWHGEHRP